MVEPGSTAAGSLGPRLAGRLTAETILRSPQYMSCIGLYHLDLRGHRLNAIENLGATQNQFDCIDFSGNNIIRLEGFPKLSRLKLLVCCTNRIATIAPALDQQIPALETLVLTDNKVERLSDLDPLAPFKRLTQLSLLENPVSKNPDFRLYAIFKLRSLKVLDFKKISVKEREAAQQKFEGMAAQDVQAAAATAAPAPDVAAASSDAVARTKEDKMRLEVALASAQTIAEVHRIEGQLKAGQLPELAEDSAMEEG